MTVSLLSPPVTANPAKVTRVARSDVVLKGIEGQVDSAERGRHRDGLLLAMPVSMNAMPGTTTVIVYGDLPEFRKPGVHGKQGPLVFDGKLTVQNRRSFEYLLVRELGRLMDRNLMGATVKPLRSRLELQQLLRARKFSTVVFYGHTIDITANGPIEGRQELALARRGEFMSPRDFANALKAGGVSETLIAGCSSVSFAAGVFTIAPSIRAGGLAFDRHDEAKGNARVVIDLRIQKQSIRWWASPGSR